MLGTCPGVIVTGVAGEALCVDDLGAPLAWQSHAYPFELDMGAAAEPFFAGFALMFTFWALGKGVAVVLRMVR